MIGSKSRKSELSKDELVDMLAMHSNKEEGDPPIHGEHEPGLPTQTFLNLLWTKDGEAKVADSNTEHNKARKPWRRSSNDLGKSEFEQWFQQKVDGNKDKESKKGEDAMEESEGNGMETMQNLMNNPMVRSFLKNMNIL